MDQEALQTGQAGALTVLVETILAQDEREGGRTMRELARHILVALMAELPRYGASIPSDLKAELTNSSFDL
jgi:hypothetical protein